MYMCRVRRQYCKSSDRRRVSKRKWKNLRKTAKPSPRSLHPSKIEFDSLVEISYTRDIDKDMFLLLRMEVMMPKTDNSSPDKGFMAASCSWYLEIVEDEKVKTQKRLC